MCERSALCILTRVCRSVIAAGCSSQYPTRGNSPEERRRQNVSIGANWKRFARPADKPHSSSTEMSIR